MYHVELYLLNTRRLVRGDDDIHVGQFGGRAAVRVAGAKAAVLGSRNFSRGPILGVSASSRRDKSKRPLLAFYTGTAS